MPDPRIPLKNQYLAAVLAYLVPGAGHFYQGRLFKGMLYFVCIVGTYLFGLYVSEGKAVYWRMEPGNRNIAFFAQAGVGAVAIPAIIQHRRFVDPDNQQPALELPFSAKFHLLTDDGGAEGEIVGRITLDSVEGEFGREIRGAFTGTQIDESGRESPLDLKLAGPVYLQPEIAAGERRELRCERVEVQDGREVLAGSIVGYIRRPFLNRFAVPLDNRDLDDLNGRLGKFFELAKVFTWIAGLLNLLAVWDAMEGPAYGYGDEEEEPEAEKKETPATTAAAEPGSQAASAADGSDGEPQTTEKKAAAGKPLA